MANKWNDAVLARLPSIEVLVVRLSHGKSLPLPQYLTPGSVAMDIYAAISEPITISPLERVLIPSGICIAIPAGFEGQIRPRSGLAHKHGLTVLNSPGTIDSDYRGEIKVMLINLGSVEVSVSSGDRIAQLLVAPVSRVTWVEVEKLSETVRGDGGFGHTG